MATKKKLNFGDYFDGSFANMTPKDVKDNLEGIFYGKEEGNYTKRLTEDEIIVAKSNLADNSIKIAKLNDEKKEAMDEFKDKFKPLDVMQKELLDAIRFRTVRKEGVLYLLDDPETMTMYKVDERGVVVDSRPMLAEERQQVIRMRTASNDNQF